jgi:hypothetical protein
VVKSSDVTAAPIQTSLQATFVSGRTLKIMAKSSVVTPNESNELTDSNKNAGAGRTCPMNFPRMASAALKASDSSSRKPVPRTSPNDKKRFLIVEATKPSERGSTFQMLLRAS